jgi:hypothetical protein
MKCLDHPIYSWLEEYARLTEERKEKEGGREKSK